MVNGCRAEMRSARVVTCVWLYSTPLTKQLVGDLGAGQWVCVYVCTYVRYLGSSGGMGGNSSMVGWGGMGERGARKGWLIVR